MQIKELRARAHKLEPVVIIGAKGLTDEVLAEIDRALKAHELIKVRAALERDERDEALQHVREFRHRTAAMNEHLQSAPVGAQLDRADKLEHDVAAAFEGEDQGERQNLLSKSAGAAAIDARRAGSKRK